MVQSSTLVGIPPPLWPFLSCFDLPEVPTDQTTVTTLYCHVEVGHQWWRYTMNIDQDGGYGRIWAINHHKPINISTYQHKIAQNSTNIYTYLTIIGISWPSLKNMNIFFFVGVRQWEIPMSNLDEQDDDQPWDLNMLILWRNTPILPILPFQTENLERSWSVALRRWKWMWNTWWTQWDTTSQLTSVRVPEIWWSDGGK